MKSQFPDRFCKEFQVTPCVGVWIEIFYLHGRQVVFFVTPCVGVWIEISRVPPHCTPHSSLPAWECGLKSNLYEIEIDDKYVTPCVGVWIEIFAPCLLEFNPIWSLPAWECGLKSHIKKSKNLYQVTPCVGVWIEIKSGRVIVNTTLVTPCVGVWIEIPIVCCGAMFW